MNGKEWVVYVLSLFFRSNLLLLLLAVVWIRYAGGVALNQPWLFCININGLRNLFLNCCMGLSREKQGRNKGCMNTSK